MVTYNTLHSTVVKYGDIHYIYSLHTGKLRQSYTESACRWKMENDTYSFSLWSAVVTGEKLYYGCSLFTLSPSSQPHLTGKF